ncbi:MAG: DUF2071 domain-containing protein, partial [Verrucomicrobia bacterium]|nr:DUF2071 domain-containing protein [Verrucomicrobiota bacterium]
MLRRPTPSGIDAITTLRHFAIVTYAVPPGRLRALVDPRFDLDCVVLDGSPMALLSVVCFEDQDFRAAVLPTPHWRFGQTNYRAYIRDRVTGQRAAWFFGTTLGSWTVALPRWVWRLPWYYGRFSMDCPQDASGRYRAFRISTQSQWAPALLELDHTPEAPLAFPGFPDRDTGLVVLTHPLIAYYARRDGRLGTYAVWHAPLAPSSARVRIAQFGLLDRLGL